MKGTIVNAVAICCGSLIGIYAQGSLLMRYQEPVLKALKIVVGLIGLQMALKSENLLIIILSLVIGIIVGETLNLDSAINKLANYLSRQTAKVNKNVQGSRFQEGFITATLVFCIGAMAIVGSIQDGLTGNAEILYLKSILDGITSMVFASTFGIGVFFSGVAVFLYQAVITLAAGFFSVYLTEPIIREMTAVGGISIVALSLQMLELIDIKIVNWLPAIFIAGILAAVMPKF